MPNLRDSGSGKDHQISSVVAHKWYAAEPSKGCLESENAVHMSVPNKLHTFVVAHV